MQNILVNKRQQIWNEKRKKQNQRTFHERRVKFLNRPDLITPTQQYYRSNIHMTNPISSTNLPLYQRNILSKQSTKVQIQSSLKVYDKNIGLNQYSYQQWIKNSKTDNPILKEAYIKQFFCVLEQISVFNYETIKQILEIFHNFIMYKPALQFQSSKECVQKIQRIICSIRLNQDSFYLAIECISNFVKDDYISILCKNKEFISTLIGYYLIELQEQKNLETIIHILDRIFSWNDEQLFFENLNFLKILHNNLNAYPAKILAFALDTLTNLVLIGPNIISYMFQSNIIESLTEIFYLAPIVIKQKVIIVFYNMMIVASEEHKIAFFSKNTLTIPLFCIQNKFSLNSVHLSLKILSKAVRLAYQSQRKFPYFWNYIKSYFGQPFNLNLKLMGLIQDYHDQFIHDESLSLIELLNVNLQDRMQQQI